MSRKAEMKAFVGAVNLTAAKLALEEMTREWYRLPLEVRQKIQRRGGVPEELIDRR